MDIGQDHLPLLLTDGEPGLLAEEAVDTPENAGFDRIGSLAGLSSNGEPLAWLSEKNLISVGDENLIFSPSAESAKTDRKASEPASKNDRLGSVALLIEDWRDGQGTLFNASASLSDARLSALGPSLWSLAAAEEAGSAPAGQDATSVTPPRADGIGSSFSLSGSASIVSDYRFRGVSLSGTSFRPQGSLELSHDSGFYGGVWTSGIKNGPSDFELDLYAGWRGKAGGLDLDVGAVAYLYPGSSGFNYVEFLASAAYTIGSAELKAGIGYAPKQSNIGSADNLYAFGEAKVAIPDTPVTLSAHLGREAGSLAGATERKWDWSLGAEVVVDKFTLGLTYVDTNVNRLLDPAKLASPGVVASFKFEF